MFAAVLVITFARPQSRDGDAQIVRQETNNIGVGGFQYRYVSLINICFNLNINNFINLFSRYETSNGIAAEETGQVVNEGREDEDIVITGQFKFIGLDGVTYLVTYTADKDGFRPQGAHLPQSP